jgi:hypothetical protein
VNDEVAGVVIAMKPGKRDSGVDLCGSGEKFVNSKKSGNVKIKNRKSSAEKIINGNDIHFKSGMIFDLEM